MTSALVWMLAAGCATCALALASVVRLRLRERQAVGAPLYAVRGGRRSRLLVAGAAVLLLVLACRWELALAVPGAGLAACSLGLALLSPAAGDRVCGASGVRAGWEVLAHVELAEWRLTGDHLRFRGREEWAAVDLPRPLQGQVRALLEQRCAAAESPFRA